MPTAQEIVQAGGLPPPARVFGQSRHQLDRGWEDFLSGASRETIGIRSPIIDSWERCRAFQVRPETAYAPQLRDDALDVRRRNHRTLLRLSAETLSDAADILIGTDTIMLVTDPDGVVLEGVGDAAVLHAANDIALGRGGDWREGMVGTNGIGVALATARPMLVHGGEHYCERMKSWSCAAAPIVDPCDGSVAGVLNVSARSHVANSQIFALAVLGARRIEQALLHQTDAFRARLLEIALEQSQRYRCDAMVAVDARGRLAYASQHAARLLRDRVDVRLTSSTPGQRAFAHAGPAGLPQVPDEWMRPIHVDGEVGGYMLIVPAQTATSVGQSAAMARRRANVPDPARTDFSTIVGESPAIREAIHRADRIAPGRIPVLIEGETGVGKELFARAIHGRSGAAPGKFVAFNCGAVSRELIASELFGYARGAFTGSNPEGRAGRFELADGGTLCLDEIGELALDLQPYLLRVLEDGVVNRIGEAQARPVNVRIVAMTNRDLRAEVEAGRFRRDLYHRLAAATILVPPLRQRPGDIDRLLDHFTATLAQRAGRPPLRFTPEALSILRRYDWPGNVRQLRNVIETAMLLAQDGIADLDCLPADLTDISSATPPALPSPTDERTRIEQAIRSTAGHMSMACTLLGMSRATLYRKMAQYGLDRKNIRASVSGG